MRDIKVSSDKLMAAYTKASDNERKMLCRLYGERVFQVSIKNRVKTYEDACDEMDVPAEVLSVSIPFPLGNTMLASVTAYAKLAIICKALNQGRDGSRNGEIPNKSSTTLRSNTTRLSQEVKWLTPSMGLTV